MNTPTDLTPDEVAALSAVRGGADVRSYKIAKDLRAVNKRHPGLVTISGPMGEYGVREELPYLGAILTDDGVRAVEANAKNARRAAISRLLDRAEMEGE